MVSIAQKTELSRLREQFSRDLGRLRQKYENLEISRKSGIDPANLSSYGSGKKAPGLKVLLQFYEAFPDEIQNPFNNHEAPASNEIEAQEARVGYHDAGPRAELIETLKRENAHLRESLDKLLAANEKLVQSTLMMAEANSRLVTQFTAKNVS